MWVYFFACFNRNKCFCGVKCCRLYIYKSSSNSSKTSFFWCLYTMSVPIHSLNKLANSLYWMCFRKTCAPLFCADNGCLSKPIRLMVGLLICSNFIATSQMGKLWCSLQKMYTYRYFCGLAVFSVVASCAASEIVLFCYHIGEQGIELILK